jgi:hypothetical protein
MMAGHVEQITLSANGMGIQWTRENFDRRWMVESPAKMSRKVR